MIVASLIRSKDNLGLGPRQIIPPGDHLLALRDRPPCQRNLGADPLGIRRFAAQTNGNARCTGGVLVDSRFLIQAVDDQVERAVVVEIRQRHSQG